MTLWSIGWIKDVVLGGKNKISTLGWDSKTASPWLLQLSRSKRTLNDKFSFARNALTSGMKDLLNHSLKFIWVTHAVLFHFQNTGRSSFRFPLSARGFSDRYTNIGLHRYVPDAFAQNSSVNRSLATLKPGAFFSSLVKNVREGILFQKRPVSSQLKICWGTNPFSSINWRTTAGNSCAATWSADALSPIE